jgi:hypothetical protein
MNNNHPVMIVMVNNPVMISGLLLYLNYNYDSLEIMWQ